MSLKLSIDIDELPSRYDKLVTANPLLARLEGQLRSYHWTDEQIRTAQLILAVESNASLSQRIRDLEAAEHIRATSPIVVGTR